MRWVILSHEAPPAIGGVATWTGWAQDALATRHQVDLVAPATPALRPLRTTLRALPRLIRADAVLCSTWQLGRFVPGAHLVAHGSDITRTRPDPAVWARAAGRWAVSDYLVDQLASHGIEAQRLPVPLPQAARALRGPRLLFVGRAVQTKGGDRFLRLAAALDMPADVVGEGPALADWKRAAPESVRFHGALSRVEVHRMMHRAAALVLLPRAYRDGSGAEGLGLVLLEARARGIPVIGCATGGVPEAVGEGLLIDPDRPDLDAVRTHLTTTPLRPTDSPEAFLEALCA